jgi:16S rRNA (guanine527-N7)-methyltransferase
MAPADVAALIAGAAQLGVEIEQQAIDRIGRFLALLLEWNQRSNLTGERDQTGLLRRHVVDSAAPVPWLPPRGLIIDVGSGAGFPGIVLGCLRPDLDLVMVESRRRPTSFLREVIRAVPLPKARALELRAEDAARDPSLAGKAAVVVARAIRLPLFLRLAAPLAHAEGSVIAMQTPRTAADADRETSGLTLEERRAYSLPDGEQRVLLRFVRRTVS